MEFKSNKQGICPVCGSRIVSWGDVDIQGDYVAYGWYCPDCGHDGQEWYKLIFDGHEVSIADEDGEYDWENVNDYILPEE